MNNISITVPSTVGFSGLRLSCPYSLLTPFIVPDKVLFSYAAMNAYLNTHSVGCVLHAGYCYLSTPITSDNYEYNQVTMSGYPDIHLDMGNNIRSIQSCDEPTGYSSQIAIDRTSYPVAFACMEHRVPLILIKVPVFEGDFNGILNLVINKFLTNFNLPNDFIISPYRAE